jgi:iron(III) transport system substrate-binding protein
MQFLSAGEAQKIYAEQVFEYPVLPGAEPSAIVKGFGPIKPDTLPLVEIAKNRKLASELVDKVGMNDGPTE